jgi:hypothetical protein
LKQISTVSEGAKWWTAMQTGKWINNQEGYVTDVSKLEATILSLTGMSPQEQDDMFLRNQMTTGEIDAQKAAFKSAIIDYRRGLEAYRNGDPEQGDSFTRNARATLEIAGYPPEKLASFIAIANRGYESMIDETDQYRLEYEYTIGEIKKALGTDSVEFISELGEGLTKLRADGKDVSLRDAVIKVELMRAATKEPKC